MDALQHISRVRIELESVPRAMSFESTVTAAYTDAITSVLDPSLETTVWLYTPMALEIALALRPSLLVYDVMDDLAAFRYALPTTLLRQRQALRAADVVFTGGRSLHRGVVDHRPDVTHCFPSGVEPRHYAPASTARTARGDNVRPVAGYVGVIDERIDLALVADLATRAPDWDIQMVGPVVKIEESDLPRADNLHYLGTQPYAALPAVMAEFDVALMPFALNEATRSISPTKTLEYLAAGLPVVSTRVADVVADYGEIVMFADDGGGFASACRAAMADDVSARAALTQRLVREHDWDSIAARMAVLLDSAGAGRVAERETA
ncbi:MAG TPA: glycosyltransferase [Acidimicrobiia bacterium]|nr:glycosyltransferase [Acidimicrobiia bacterium]